MYTTIHYILPVILLACALGLIHKEWVVFTSSFPRPWVLLVRRFLGALALVAIAIMLHSGDTTLILMEKSQAAEFARANRQYATSCLHYWFTMMGIVLATACLAVWDAIDVLRRLRSVIDASANADMQAFRQILEKSKASSAKVREQSAREEQANSQPRVNAQPQLDDQPKVNAQPKANAHPQLDDQPKVNAQPKANAQPQLDDQPKANAQPQLNDQPKVNAQPKANAQPQLDDQPKVNA